LEKKVDEVEAKEKNEGRLEKGMDRTALYVRRPLILFWYSKSSELVPYGTVHTLCMYLVRYCTVQHCHVHPLGTSGG
jgi:hypothetical protein